MKISDFFTRKSNLTDPVAIQLKSSGFNPDEKIFDQQETLSQILAGLGIKHAKSRNNISVDKADYNRLRSINIVSPAIYQRKITELDQPVLVYILKKKYQGEENEFINPQEVVKRLEKNGFFYAIPQEEKLALYLLMEKSCVAKFRKLNFKQYREHVGVFFPAV